MLTDKRTKNGQTNRQNYTNFKNNLAMMVIYLPVKVEFNWTKRFWLTVRKRKCWWTDKRTKNGQMNIQNYTSFQSNLALMVIYLPVKFEIDWTKHFRVRVQKQKCWWTKNGPILKTTLLWWWSISLLSLNYIGQSVFELESRNGMVMDRQMDKKQTNKQTELHQFQK